MQRRRVSEDKETRVGSNVGAAVLTNSAALSSRLCGCQGTCAQRAWFAKSEIVSVAVQKKGGELFQPMGRVRGMANIS